MGEEGLGKVAVVINLNWYVMISVKYVLIISINRKHTDMVNTVKKSRR